MRCRKKTTEWEMIKYTCPLKLSGQIRTRAATSSLPVEARSKGEKSKVKVSDEMVSFMAQCLPARTDSFHLSHTLELIPPPPPPPD